jgi:nitroreductase
LKDGNNGLIELIKYHLEGGNMQFDQVIQTRRSIRNFKPDPVSDKAITEILEAARLAASGSNIQPWRFVVIRSQEIKEKLKATTRWRFALKAPVIIACCTDLSSLDGRQDRLVELTQAGVFDNVEMDGEYSPPEKNREQLLSYLNMNVGIAITQMMLKAVDLGLGTCWIGGFDPIKTKEILGLDDNLHIVALLPIGYPERIPLQRPRFPLEKLIVKTV